MIEPFNDIPDPHSVAEWFAKEGGGFESRRFPIVNAREWDAEVHFEALADTYQIMPFFHLAVTDTLFTHKTLNTMLATWKAFREQNPGILFTIADQDTPALDRLRHRFGFIRLEAQGECSDGKSRRLFVLLPGA